MLTKEQIEDWLEHSVTKFLKVYFEEAHNTWESKPGGECFFEGEMEKTYVNLLDRQVREEVYAELLEVFDGDMDDLMEDEDGSSEVEG